MNAFNQDRRLDVVLAEYKALRGEILQKFQNHIQLYAIIGSLLVIGLTYIIYNEIYDALLIIPVITSALAYRFIWEQSVIVTIGRYIKEEIEEVKIPELIGYRGNISEKNGSQHQYWMAWEHFFMENFPMPKIPRIKFKKWTDRPFAFYMLAFLILFIFIPFFPAIFWNIICIGSYAHIFDFQALTCLPNYVHILSLIICCILCSHIFIEVIRT